MKFWIALAIIVSVLIAGKIMFTAKDDYLLLKNSPMIQDRTTTPEKLDSLINSNLNDTEIANKIRNSDYSPSELNENFKEYETPVFLAIKRGYTETLKALLEKGADPNKSRNIKYFFDDNQNVKILNATPLLFAILNGNTDAYRILLNFGADENASFLFLNTDNNAPYGCLNFNVADILNADLLTATDDNSTFLQKVNGEDLYVFLPDYIFINPEYKLNN